MAKQTINWTALPNGYSDDGRSLRISVLVSPRLETDGPTGVLEDFPDFADWPATLAQSVFTVTYGAAPPVKIAGNDLAGVPRIDNRIGLANSRVWQALFPRDTRVRKFEFLDRSNQKVLSYPATEIDKLVRNLYSKLAASATDKLPTAATFLGDTEWQQLLGVLREHDVAYRDRKTGMRRPKKQFEDFKGGAFKGNTRHANLALFQLFHTPPSKATPRKDKVPDGDPKRGAEWLGYEQVPMPTPEELEKEIHFHKIVAAMNQYPTLLRGLGLVVDLLVRRDAFPLAADSLLSVAVELPPPTSEVQRVADASPRTHARLDDKRFQPVPRVIPASQGGFRVVDGLLELNPQTFDLLQADVDGSGIKVVDFAHSLLTLEQGVPEDQLDPVTRIEREMGAPSLRNAGLMLVQTKRGEMLEATIKRQTDFNSALPVKPVMFAQDLVRGYRIDIWDDVSKKWHSLCQRQAIYNIADGEVVIEVPAEEGTVRLVATTSRDKTSNPDIIWLHETLVSWAGWSLCAPPPGKTIHHQTMGPDPKDPTKQIVVHEDPVGEPEAEVPDGLRLQSTLTALPGSLPRLRYGRRYWLRARAVDLAGNSLAPQSKDFGPENPKANAHLYSRFDPISAPALALVKPNQDEIEKPLEGESMERMAVRSLNDTSNLNHVPTTQRTRRFAVPSRTTQREAEQHGMLDRNGVVDPSTFAFLETQDYSLADEIIESAGPLAGGKVKTKYAAMIEGAPLPYLPDPLALEIAARIFDHPDFPNDEIITIPFYAGTEWPEALPFKIEIYEDPGEVPHYEEAVRTLFIPLPKAARATLRLSVQPDGTALQILGIWNWLTPAQQNKLVRINGQPMSLEKIARRGQHWMLTPWRNVEIVHAVQRPLITPELEDLEIYRTENQTFVQPIFSTPCSLKSTDRVDLRANWNEPFDDGAGKDLGNHERIDHAFSMKITEEKSYKGFPDYTPFPPGIDRIAVNKRPVKAPVGVADPHMHQKFHEFHDTRYRRIEYWLEATTKFREFMSAGLLLDKKKKPTEENINVVSGKGRTWIKASAPPPAPEVLYVVPTFGWVRSGDETERKSWRRGGGLRVYLNRPWSVSGYGEMLAVVLPPANFNGDPNILPADKPMKNFVTQWGNDPIWLSPYVPGVAPKLANFPLARTRPDPDGKWLPKFAPPEEADQRPGNFDTTGLTHPDFPDPPAHGKVDIAPHDVFYDEVRQLWYCDIEVTWGAAYFPFIRLALARYQPGALDTAHLSNVVLADFMQLVPDRWLNVTHTGDVRTRKVKVYGHTYSDSAGHAEGGLSASFINPGQPPIRVESVKVSASSIVEVWVEVFDAALGEDFGWKREAGAIVHHTLPDLAEDLVGDPRLRTEVTGFKARARANDLLINREYEALIAEGLLDLVSVTPTLWEGNVTLPTLPASGIDKRHRLAIAEYEEYFVDDEEPYNDFHLAKDRRLVFIEYVELG
ncbi:MAG: hypothetical protein QOD75_352 [Blastocatellia bacterium]|jgi:hypothetical protein|nr:hypothetical protein [Blastocatellia bacterium]